MQQNQTKSRRNYRNYPPRPCNSFMIYRREYHQNIRKRFPNIILSEVSVISRSAADEWAQEPPHVKERYIEKARVEKERHMNMYPNNVYCPKKPRRPNCIFRSGSP